MIKERLSKYLNKFSWCDQCLGGSVSESLSLIVVIPCFHELDLISSLESLKRCAKPVGTVEVIVVFNCSVNTDSAIRAEHEGSIEPSTKWMAANGNDWISFHSIVKNDLPRKHSGVGLARKIGMDEAARRFASINKDGIIDCYDADNNCDENYLVEIEKHFNLHPDSPGASIHFEHPVVGDEFDVEVYKGIVKYELFLRFYIQGLRYIGFPYAFHTIGSSMVVRCSAYMKQGGMNKRKAGEDFYFLQKIFLLGDFTEISSTCVRPSPRSSDRVPFGTGKQIGKFLEDGSDDYEIYDPASFIAIKQLFDSVGELGDANRADALLVGLPKVVQAFLIENKWQDKLAEINKNTTNEASFRKRFFQWFDGFMVLKFMHFSRDAFYSNKLLPLAANELLMLSKASINDNLSLNELLDCYRQLDRKGLKSTKSMS